MAAAVLALLAPVFTLAQQEPIPIGIIQGEVGERERSRYPSPFEGETVTVQGIVHQLLLRPRREGRAERGFFIQNTVQMADGNPQTSDALFVFQGRHPGIKDLSGRVHVPEPGDELILTGKVREHFNTTGLGNVRLAKVVRKGIDLDRSLPAQSIPKPAGPSQAHVFHERLESMRVVLPPGSMAQGGRNVFGQNANAEIWFAPPIAPGLGRESLFARRVFRDAHPLDDMPGPTDNGNAHLITVGSLGLKGNLNDPSALLEPLRTFDILQSPLPGALEQRYDTYVVQVASQPVVLQAADPAENGRHPPPDPATHFTIASFNVENLFDHRNDPQDGCDFPTDPGTDLVTRPFNYLPATEKVYREKLKEIALQIVYWMNGPDLILMQEVEDQDILSTSTKNDRLKSGSDGKLDALQELCGAIFEQGGMEYCSAADRDAAGYRGIACAFLYRPDRVHLAPATETHTLLGKRPGIEYRGTAHAANRDISNPKAFNANLPDDVNASSGMSTTNVFPRAVVVGKFRITSRRGLASPMVSTYVVNNHFSSRPNQRVGQRREQALYNRRIVEAIWADDPEALILLGGDLNVFPRPDEPIRNRKTDQLAHLYEAGLTNTHDEMLQTTPAGAYTSVYRGQAGTLDHFFLSPTLHRRLAGAWIGHFNADWPDSNAADSPFGASDHDPLIAHFRFSGE